MWGSASLICFPISLVPGFPNLQTRIHVHPGVLFAFQGVHYSQNLNCRGDGLIPNCGDLFFLLCGSSIEFGGKISSRLWSGPFFGLQARFWVYRASFFIIEKYEKSLGCTSELINGQRVPMNRKFGKPWTSVHQHLNSSEPILVAHPNLQTSDECDFCTCHRTLFSDYSDQSLTTRSPERRFSTAGTALRSGVLKLGYIYPQEYIKLSIKIFFPLLLICIKICFITCCY